jgi:putative ABC transport system permease protein
VGASIGVLFGLGLPLVLRSLVQAVTIRVSGLSAVLALLFSCAVTVLFGVYPAMHAAGMNPTEALRHE